MPYSELAYFTRNACAHVASYEEHLRLTRFERKFTTMRRGDRIRDRAFA